MFITGNNVVTLRPEWSATSNTPRIARLNMTVESDKGTFNHQFTRRSSLVRQTDATPIEDIQARLQNGTFLFDLEGGLVDYRANDYKGFVHTEDAVKRLIDELGFNSVEHITGHRRPASFVDGEVTVQNQRTGGKLWGSAPFQVPGMNEGGDWEAKIAFTWDPFSPNIHSMTSLVRLICANGLTATRGIMDYMIPVVSNWNENLEIAYRRLQNKLQGKVVDRLGHMANERATIADVMLLNSHANRRLEAARTALVHDAVEFRARSEQVARLQRIAQITNVESRLKDVYTSEVFTRSSNAAVVPSDITSFDALNLATEMMSHVSSNSVSTNAALTGVANDMIFKSRTTSASRSHTAPKLNAFSNPDDAFMAAVA